MGGGGKSTTTQGSTGQQTSSSESHIEIPSELKPLYTQSASGMMNLQNLSPLWGGGAGGSTNYLAANPMQTAGADPLQTWAAEGVKGLGDQTEAEKVAMQYGLKASSLAGRMATGAGAATDPAVLAASDAFEKLMAPGIENQMGLAGLGKSSSLANALALGKSSQMAPLITDYINREQNALNNEANMYAGLMPQFTALGGVETSREQAALNDAMQIGGTMRGIEQEPLTAQYQDFLRRQALSEQALFVPFGATAGASIGPNATSESQGTQESWGSGKASQGMFK